MIEIGDRNDTKGPEGPAFWRVRLLISSLGIAVLASCSGGGGGGGGSNGLSNNPSATFLQPAAEPTTPFAASDWSTSQEYQNSTGLAQVKAAEGYAQRTAGLPGGQGVRIAIIDSGIDLTHADLGNLAAQSWSAGGEGLIGESHGTFVAGIAAASRTQTGDANDMHGLGYQATLVNFQAARPSVTQANGSVSFSSPDLVSAITTAAGLSSGSAGVESDILNLSLGAFSTSDSSFSSLRTAMQSAAALNKIMVLAAGNEGQDADATRKLQPIYPAAYADDAGIAGLAIVVGNLTATDQAAASSNLCGDTKNYCLFAPGTNIRSTLTGGGYGIGSGTSFAAPYVSGAAAVVKAAFPGVSSQDVVNRLLLTAADLGAAGVDDVFGRGRLDLEAAMAPIGPVGLPIGPSATGPSVAITSSSLRLGPAWSIDDQNQALLERAVGFDEMGFPFPANLDRKVKSTKRSSGLARFIGAERGLSASASSPHASLTVSIADDLANDLTDDARREVDDPTSFNRETTRAAKPELTFDMALGRHITGFASLHGSSATTSGLGEALRNRHMSLFQSAMFLEPFDHLNGPSSGGGLSFTFFDHVDIALSAFASVGDEQTPKKTMQKLEVSNTLFGDVALRLGLGWLQEDNGFLGVNGTGAFGEALDSRSQFVDLSLVAPINERVDWFSTYSHGRSSIDSDRSGALSQWSSVRSEAFATGLSIRDMAVSGDVLSLMVGQPFRGDHAKVTLNLPVGRTKSGTVVSEQQRIDLEPSSREFMSEATYRWPLGQRGDQEIKAGGFIRLNPDHDANRATAFGLGVVYRWQF